MYTRKGLTLCAALLLAAVALTALVPVLPARAEGNAPVAQNLELTTYRNVSVGGRLTAVDPDGDTLTFQITTEPTKGEIELTDDGLRIIEISKENMLCIPAVRELVADNPLKFIIFIDDLSLDEYDEKVSSLKAGLEGSVSGGTENVMIAATSNRRHIVKESFSDRENSVHPGDSIAEQLSLSDRFGLTVMFSTTDKSEYLSIVGQLADDAGIKTDRQQLFALAERWALTKGGRSPRRAKQFADLAYACEQRGVPIDF